MSIRPKCLRCSVENAIIKCKSFIIREADVERTIV